MIKVTNDVRATNGADYFWAERQSVAVIYFAGGDLEVIPLPEGKNTKKESIKSINKWLDKNTGSNVGMKVKYA